ncbi:NAP1- protein 2 [Stylosanthes scabra]|uniref:NAP1- protein 2 n=1 Tax=Stylosanthes scabra TaxID=79078 RepID=A0ABU6V9S4_9FABA|nr:NAP1- protein 2 [Stylosanthes scabra]
MAGDRSKKLKASEKSDNLDEVHGHLLISIEKLQQIQDELEKINDKAGDEVLEIEQKYNEIRKPIYDKRNDLIKSIPDFWLTAFMSHPTLSELLNEEDIKIFKYLSSLEVEDHKDVKSGFKITLNFNPNPYFEETKLVKTFNFLEEGTTKITATPIKWKEGKGIPNGVNHEDKGNKRSLDDISFFSWFSDCEQKDDMDENEIHDEVAEIIKDDLWPNPLTYVNNEEIDDEDGDDEANDEENDEDDSEDDDQEDEEDDDNNDDDDDNGN